MSKSPKETGWSHAGCVWDDSPGPIQCGDDLFAEPRPDGTYFLHNSKGNGRMAGHYETAMIEWFTKPNKKNTDD